MERRAAVQGLGIVEQVIRTHIERLRDGDKDRQAELGVCGLDVAHVGRGNADALRELLLGKAARLPDLADALSNCIIIHIVSRPYTLILLEYYRLLC